MSLAIKQQTPHANLGAKVFKPLMNLGIKTFTNYVLNSHNVLPSMLSHTASGIIHNVANSADVVREPVKNFVHGVWNVANHIKKIKQSTIEKAKKSSRSVEKSNFH